MTDGGSPARAKSVDAQRGAKVKCAPRAKLPRPAGASPCCPRCHADGSQTKFCYYNNYNVKQPRYFCRACQRHWTAGGVLREIESGGRRRKCRRKSTTATTRDASPVPPTKDKRVRCSDRPQRCRVDWSTVLNGDTVSCESDDGEEHMRNSGPKGDATARQRGGGPSQQQVASGSQGDVGTSSGDAIGTATPSANESAPEVLHLDPEGENMQTSTWLCNGPARHGHRRASKRAVADGAPETVECSPHAEKLARGADNKRTSHGDKSPTPLHNAVWQSVRNCQEQSGQSAPINLAQALLSDAHTSKGRAQEAPGPGVPPMPCVWSCRSWPSDHSIAPGSQHPAQQQGLVMPPLHAQQKRRSPASLEALSASEASSTRDVFDREGPSGEDVFAKRESTERDATGGTVAWPRGPWGPFADESARTFPAWQGMQCAQGELPSASALLLAPFSLCHSPSADATGPLGKPRVGATPKSGSPKAHCRQPSHTENGTKSQLRESIEPPWLSQGLRSEGCLGVDDARMPSFPLPETFPDLACATYCTDPDTQSADSDPLMSVVVTDPHPEVSWSPISIAMDALEFRDGCIEFVDVERH